MAEKMNLFKDEKATREKRLASLLSSDELSDCKFAVGAERKIIAAHRFLLAVMSPVMYLMFFGDSPETGVIEITDVTLQGFNGMLQYVYTGSIIFRSVEHAVDTLATAKKYMLPLVEKACLDYLENNMTPINCLELLEIANDLQCDSLEKCCVEFLRENTTGVLTSDTFLKARQSSVTKVVEQDSLHISSEIELYKLIERWLMAECERKGKALKDMVDAFSDIINNLRFLSMSTDEFASAPANSDILNADMKVAIFMWFSERDSEHLPSGLSRLSSRCMTGKSRQFSIPFDVPSLARMNYNQWSYSQKGCTVQDIYWKVAVYRNSNGSYVFYICTEEKNESLQEPKKAWLRVFKSNGGKVEVTHWRDGGLTRDWVDIFCSYHGNGHLCLQMCYMTKGQFILLDDTIRVEVLIEA